MKKITIIGQLAAKFGRVILNNAAIRSMMCRKEAEDADTVLIMEHWTARKGWTEDLSLEEVAEKLGLSKEDLSRYFRLHAGKNFLQWRRAIRIEEAKRQLLENKNIPTAFIGESVGIPDKSNFRRQFKRETGYTPAEWRRLKH